MDIFFIIGLAIVLFIVFSICGWCCKNKREGTVIRSTLPPVTTIVEVPQTTTYPVDPSHSQPMPNYQPGGPAPGFIAPPSHPMPYPPPGGYPPYPPAGGPPMPQPQMGYNYPPPYDVAVSQPPPQPLPAHEAYHKQAPYNPNYHN